jgi:hypothetical protein
LYSRWEGSMKVRVEKKNSPKKTHWSKTKKGWVIEARWRNAAHPMDKMAN